MKFTISKKLFLFLVLPGLLFFSFFIFYSIQRTEKIMYDLHEQVFSEKIANSAELINVLLTEATNMLHNSGVAIEKMEHIPEKELLHILEQNVKHHKFIFGSTIAYEPYAYSPDKKFCAPFIYRVGNGFNKVILDFDYTLDKYKWYSVPKKTDKPYWTEPYLSTVLEGVKLVSYCIPFHKNGKFVGVLTIDIALEPLNDILEKYLNYKSKMFAIISSKGRFVSHYNPKKIFYHTIFDSTEIELSHDIKNKLQKSMLTKNKVWGFDKIVDHETGNIFWGFYAPISEPNWTILVYVNEAELNGPIKRVFYESILIFAGATVVAILLILLLVRKAVRPIIELRKFSQQIREGNYDVQFNLGSSDEIGELADDLNNMSKQLAIREKELKALNQTLEEKVKQRTLELQKAKESTDNIIDNSPLPIAVVEKETEKVLRANAALAEMHQVPLEEVYKHTVSTWYWKQKDREKLLKIIAEKGKVINYELEGKRLKNGEKRWLLVSLFQTTYMNKEAFVVELADITESKEANLKIQKQNLEISTRNKYISDSINYAQKIQSSILPSEKYLRSLFAEYFLIYKPKDIVSGDFYWVNKIGNKKIVAVVDCTGHGVPGALMSMIGNTILNEIIAFKKITDTAEILSQMNKKIIEELNKSTNKQTYDGMDVAICVIDEEENIMEFAGAYRPLLYFKKDTLFEIKGNRKSIGDLKKEHINFTSHKIELDESVIFYLFSDGYADQNNSENKKFGLRRMKELLEKIHNLPLNQQKQSLLDELNAFKGDEIQRDDITIVEIKPLTTMVNEYKQIFSYQGEFSHEKIFEMGENIKENLANEFPSKVVKTTHFCAMELMQNIGFYSLEKNESGIGKFSVRYYSVQNFILLETHNLVETKKIDSFVKKIENFNSLSEEELKRLYKDMLKSTSDEESKGAGIGLIQIIRKTKAKIEYSVKKESEHIATLKLKVKVFINNT